MSTSEKLHIILSLFQHCNSQPNSICTYVEIEKHKIQKWLNVLDIISRHIRTLLAKNGVTFYILYLYKMLLILTQSSICWWKVNGCILICRNFLYEKVLHWWASKSYSVACHSDSCFLSQNLGLAVANNCFTLKIESPSPTPASKNADGSTRRSAGCRLIADPAWKTKDFVLMITLPFKAQWLINLLKACVCVCERTHVNTPP